MDLIDREALINAVEDLYEYAELGEVLDVIKTAPTVNDCPNCEYKKQFDYISGSGSYKELQALRKFKKENERPHGKWIKHEDGYNICPCCKHKTAFSYLFCPNCGADMRGEEEE